MKATGDIIVKAAEFKPGHRWTAGKFSLLFSIVGNLELRETSSRSLLWQSNTSGAAKLAMQDDGNLVIYAAGDKPLWASGTHGNPKATLRFQQDGNLVVYSADGRSLWTTNTSVPKPATARSEMTSSVHPMANWKKRW